MMSLKTTRNLPDTPFLSHVYFPAHEVMPASSSLPHILERFKPICLSDMDAVALMNRTDTRYVLHEAQLEPILAELSDDYWVLEIDGTRLSPYRTLYFDTPDFALYRRHHAGGRRRGKVRSRLYVETDRSFLEVKVKAKRDHTLKKRVETPDFVRELTPEQVRFVQVNVPVGVADAKAKLWNSFSRITLVSKTLKERLTLDLKLEFSTETHTVALPGVVVAEVKQDGVDRDSPFMQGMRRCHLRSSPFSKYCIGVALLYHEVKHNRFKGQLHRLEKLTGGLIHAC